jgi:magnesium transporter
MVTFVQHLIASEGGSKGLPCRAEEQVAIPRAFPEGTAGRIMTSECVALSPELTSDEALACVRETLKGATEFYYLYMTDSELHLLGVFSLRELLFADPNAHLAEIMRRPVVWVSLNDPLKRVERKLVRYRLSAIPVVDEERRLCGIVQRHVAFARRLQQVVRKHGYSKGPGTQG